LRQPAQESQVSSYLGIEPRRIRLIAFNDAEESACRRAGKTWREEGWACKSQEVDSGAAQRIREEGSMVEMRFRERHIAGLVGAGFGAGPSLPAFKPVSNW